jgi:hypothetical protein
VVRYTATCEPFHAGLGGPCRVEGHTSTNRIVQRYCVHSSFSSLVLYAGVNLIDGRLWNRFYGIAAAAMKRNLPDDQSIRDNIIILSSRRLVLIYSKLTWDFLMPLTAPEKGRNLLRQLMYDEASSNGSVGLFQMIQRRISSVSVPIHFLIEAKE